MFPRRVLVPFLAAVGLIAALPATAPAAEGDGASIGKRGSDVVALEYPSLLNQRLVRAQNAIDRVAKYADLADPSKANRAIQAAGKNLTKGMAAAEYVIVNAPPPPPPGDRPVVFHRWAFKSSGKLRIALSPSPRAHTRRAPVAGPPNASIYDSGYAILSLEHYAASTAVPLIPDVDSVLRGKVIALLNQAQRERDQMVEFIHQHPDPALPPGDRPVHKRDEVVPTWATVMPTVIPFLDDEIQEADGTLAIETALTADGKTAIRRAKTRATTTENTINAFWPPLPPGD
jgi:hypothetical protein